MTRLLSLSLLLLPAIFAGDDPVAIVRKSLALDNRNWDNAKDYTFREKQVQREIDGNGRVKKTESELNDVIVLYGRPFSRTIEKNGKPLSAKEQAKESEKFDKEVEKRRKETADENTKERRKFEERRARQRRFTNEIPEAFAFTLVGEENVSGHPTWVIKAEPKPGYKPRDERAKFLPKLRAKLWIDKSAYQWVKVEAETIDTISFGWVLARLGPGAQLRFEQKRINDEVWLPSHAMIKLDARALWKTMKGDIEIDYSDYRKFQTDSKITISETTEPHK